MKIEIHHVHHFDTKVVSYLVAHLTNFIEEKMSAIDDQLDAILEDENAEKAMLGALTDGIQQLQATNENLVVLLREALANAQVPSGTLARLTNAVAASDANKETVASIVAAVAKLNAATDAQPPVETPVPEGSVAEVPIAAAGPEVSPETGEAQPPADTPQPPADPTANA